MSTSGHQSAVRKRGLISQILSFGAGEGIARGLNWLLMAILPVFLTSTEEYGRVGLIVSLELLVANVSLVGMDRAVLRFYANDDAPGSMLRSALTIWGGVAWIPPCGVLCLYFTGHRELLGIAVAPDLLLLSIFVALFNLNFFCICIGRAQRNLGDFLRFRLYYMFLKVVFVLGFAVATGGSQSYIIGMGVAGSLMLWYTIPYLRKQAFMPAKRTVISELLLFGWPFVFHIVSGNILSYFSRFFLEIYSTTREVGIFTLAFTLGSGLFVGFAILSTYFEPKIYSHADDTARCEKWLAFYTNACVAFSAAAGAALMFVYPYLIPLLKNADYMDALPIISMSMGTILLRPLSIQGNYRLTTHKRTGYIATVTMLGAAVSIGLNVLIVPQYGIWGAAVALYFSNGIVAVGTMLISLYVARIPLRDQVTLPVGAMCLLGSAAAMIWAYQIIVVILILSAIAIVSTLFLVRSLRSLEVQR